jgi:hypothetical protein
MTYLKRIRSWIHNIGSNNDAGARLLWKRSAVTGRPRGGFLEGRGSIYYGWGDLRIEGGTVDASISGRIVTQITTDGWTADYNDLVFQVMRSASSARVSEPASLRPRLRRTGLHQPDRPAALGQTFPIKLHFGERPCCLISMSYVRRMR